jgi:hypothetical protein
MTKTDIPFVTDFAAEYVAGVSGPGAEQYLLTAIARGFACMREAGMAAESPDLALAVHMLHGELGRGMHDGRDIYDESYLFAGNVSDRISDHDAELLAQLEPEVRAQFSQPGGSMTLEVTAIHDLLCEVANTLAEGWQGGERD